MVRRQMEKGLVLAGLLILGVTPQADDRTVAVTGEGEVRATPDRALLSVAVEARHLNLEPARERVSSTVEKFLRFSDELGIDPAHVKTTGATVRPEYDWSNSNRERRLVGYYVSRRIEVDLQDLEKLGQLIEGAVELGVNQVAEPQLRVSNERELRREALALAARDARANAEALAQTLGGQVGPPRRLSTVGPVVPAPVRPMMAREAAAETYAPGELKISARVNAEFDLLVDLAD